MVTQKPNFNEPKWNSQGLTREYNDSINRGILKRDNTQGLPFIISNMNQAKTIINDFYDNKINFTEQFLDKVSYTYKGNFRPFGRLFPDELRAFLSTSKGITYSDFVIQSPRNLTPIRVEEIQQIGIDIDIPKAQPVADPNIQNINLYRILFDSVKNQNYITATHLNQPFRISDIENYRNMPKQYLVTDGSKQPLTAIGAKLYFDEIEELGILDSVIGSFEPAPVIQMTQDTTLPFKLFQEAFAEPMKLSVLPTEKIWYWVTRPTGKIEQIKVTPSGKKTLESKGWVFSKDEPKPTEIKLSDRFYKVLKQIEDGNVIIPDWFENNIRWVQSGNITEQEFFNSYNNLINIGVITTKEIEIEKPLPVEPTEPQVNDIVNFPMVKQTAIDFQIEGSRITGTVILDKISANWNNYYDGRNLIAYFQSSNLADIVLVNKPNIVKFRPTEVPLLPTEKITINESTEGKDKIKVKLFLFTEDNVPVAEPLEFLLQKGEIITAKPKPRRTDFLGLIGSGLAGAIGISLLLSGAKNNS